MSLQHLERRRLLCVLKSEELLVGLREKPAEASSGVEGWAKKRRRANSCRL
jgi:hypothetical protein